MFSQVFIEMLSFLGIVVVGGLIIATLAALSLFVYGVVNAFKKK